MFFFSSRRRHTRCGRDWSSDVCSSDLEATAIYSANGAAVALAELIAGSETNLVQMMNDKAGGLGLKHYKFVNCTGQIGRASGRERMEAAAGADCVMTKARSARSTAASA